ncbi:hypothetical protein DFP72DRAFT_1075128 [Ephemerocybe angulata]|uniref:Uncharacterized protein n=1 Tax=Ephemerocybe angulata TaxID=980116 RepID=A0A8H6M0D5_9AGAR|nr:hypothetical protein DFP72DRAFT_1075128 [Tulosesus angulatus]
MKRLDESKHVYPAKRQGLAITAAAAAGESSTQRQELGEAYQATISLAGGYHRRVVLFKPTSEIQDHGEQDIVSAICLIQLSASEGLESPLESEHREESTPQQFFMVATGPSLLKALTQEERDVVLCPLKATQGPLSVEPEQFIITWFPESSVRKQVL